MSGKSARMIASSLCFAGVLAAAEPSWADTFRITAVAGTPPTVIHTGLMKDFFIPEVDRGLAAAGGKHKIEWRLGLGGSIVKQPEVLEAIEKGIADLGLVSVIFEAAKLPLQQVTYQAPFGTENLPLLHKVIVELNKSVPAIPKAFEGYKQVMLAQTGIDTYLVFSKFPISSFGDLKGHKIGAPGVATTWLNGTGATPVNSNLPSYYNSLSTGVFEGVLVAATLATSFKLHEVAPHITRAGIGAMFMPLAMTINRRAWDGLPEEVRAIFRKAATAWEQRCVDEQTASEVKALEFMTQNGAKISSLTVEDRRRWAMSLPNSAKAWADGLEGKGQPGRQVLKAYMDGLRSAGATPLRDWDRE